MDVPPEVVAELELADPTFGMHILFKSSNNINCTGGGRVLDEGHLGEGEHAEVVGVVGR
jgi:hypothetical protein